MSETLENLLREDRTFPPPPAFTAQANARPGIHEEAAADYLAFWKRNALERISWFKEPTVVLDDTNPPFFKWFPDGELNLSYNCLDRHLADHGDQVAYHWIGEPGDTRTLTYADLAKEVNHLANGLKSLGLERGDRVAIYMGMIPELPIAMLACARLGLVHSAVFGGFSSEALSSRILDADARLVITQDGAWRGGKVVSLKVNTDRALEQTPGV
ncbi:MAG TPA: AMP-binding protein, partial [Acidimicrobiia bacterium]